MEGLLNEIRLIEDEFKKLVSKPTREKVLEEGKCFSKNIYLEHQTLSIQFYPAQAYLYCFLVDGDIKDRLTLVEFLHKNILLEKRYGFDLKRKTWSEVSGQLENLYQYSTSKEIAEYLYSFVK